MKIARGEYRLAERHLIFDLSEDLLVGEGREVFYLWGNNGVGKTSFVEKLLLPLYDRHQVKYLYLGQDIRTQIYTIKASLAIVGQTISLLDELDLFRLWVRQGRSAQAFFVDEFDKYYPDYRMLFDWSRDFIKTYVLVSHTSWERLYKPESGFGLYRLLFELVEFDGRQKRVLIRKEIL